MPVSPEQIGDILDATHLAKLKANWDRAEMRQILEDTLPLLYQPSKPYIEAIADIFGGLAGDDRPAPRKVLSPPDRERILISQLASRGGGYTLSVHLYIGLMLDITPDEIGNILLLTGIYSGVNVFTNGLADAIKALTVLRTLVESGADLAPTAVNAGLRKAFLG